MPSDRSGATIDSPAAGSPAQHTSTAAIFLKCHSSGMNGAGGAVVRLSSDVSSSGALATSSAPLRGYVDGLVTGVEHHTTEHLGPEGVERQLQRRDDAEVAAAAAQRPEQFGSSASDACTIEPSAVTISAPTRLSHVRP